MVSILFKATKGRGARARRSFSEVPERGAAFGRRLRRREPEAMARFLDLYLAPVHARVRSLVGDLHEAEDLTQDIFLKIHRSLPGYDPERKLRPWVSAIAMNHIRDHWRGSSRRAAREPELAEDALVDTDDGSEPPLAELERKEWDERVEQAVDRLPPELRTVLVLRVHDGLAFETIGKLLDLATETTRRRYARALAAIRASL